MANYIKFDVLVIGGGHAGCEAASAAARARRADGAHYPSVRHDRRDVLQSGNRGLGKGHLVREIDALDGLMGRVADAAGIQFRMLNRSKGPAVRGPRAQADRRLYKLAMQAAIRAQAGLQVIEGRRRALCLSRMDGSKEWCSRVAKGSARGLWCSRRARFSPGLSISERPRSPPDRVGEPPSIGFPTISGRTALPWAGSRPARRRGSTARSIRWEGLEVQHGDDPPAPFSFMTERISTPQIPCHITQTTAATHADHRCQSRPVTHLFGTDREHGAALLPFDRGQGRAVRRACSRIRSSLSPRGSTIRPSIPMAFRPRCREDIQEAVHPHHPGSRGRLGSYDLAMPSSMTMSIRGS